MKRALFILIGIVMIASFVSFASNKISTEKQDCAIDYSNNSIFAEMENTKNIYGEELISCCLDPVTGFYRNGLCQTGRDDYGTHIVCAQMTDEFLKYSASQGNDLITPIPDYNFPGLKAGDNWCLCISRWIEALDHGVAPPVNLKATHINALRYVDLEVLELHAQG